MKLHLKPKMSLDEMAHKLRSENRLDEEKFKKVKLELQQHRNLFVILALLVTCSAYYTGHYIHAVVLTIFFPLGIWESIAINLNNIYLHNFGAITAANVTMLKSHFYALSHWKVEYEFPDQSGISRKGNLTLQKKKYERPTIGSSIPIIYDPNNPDNVKQYIENQKYEIKA